MTIWLSNGIVGRHQCHLPRYSWWKSCLMQSRLELLSQLILDVSYFVGAEIRFQLAHQRNDCRRCVFKLVDDCIGSVQRCDEIFFCCLSQWRTRIYMDWYRCCYNRKKTFRTYYKIWCFNVRLKRRQNVHGNYQIQTTTKAWREINATRDVTDEERDCNLQYNTCYYIEKLHTIYLHLYKLML